MCNQVMVAHHEAAHAVVAYKLGEDLHEVYIENNFSGKINYWTGLAPLITKPSPVHCALIGVAGLLAEIKLSLLSEAELFSGNDFTTILCPVKFLPESIPSIAKALWYYFDTEPPNGCFEVNVKLHDGNRIESRELSLFQFEGDMDLVLNAIGNSLEDLEQIVRETSRLLDEPDNWKAVLLLAEELMKRRRVLVRH